MGNTIGILLSIILLDLVLSGDNAIVIGAAASTLPARQQKIAIMIGGAAAIFLRIVFTGFISWLLQLPYLQVAGGIVLILISIRLLMERSSSRRKSSETDGEAIARSTSHQRRMNFFFVMLAIILADTTTSLDNMVAVGALAAGNFLLLAIGLVISISILLIGSAFIARISARIPWLLDVAALILALTAANTILADNGISDDLANNLIFKIFIFTTATVIVLVADYLLHVRDKRHRVQAAN